ncbi:MAG: lysostaphin resistance A-like protein [Thermoplasmatota archaeon]
MEATLTAPVAFGAMAEWLGYEEKLLLSWAGGLLVAVAAIAIGRRSARWALGAALVSVPIWSTFWGIIDSIEVLTDPNSVLRPYSQRVLSRVSFFKILGDVGYIGAGFLLMAAPSWRGVLRQRLDDLAAAARRMGLPMGGRSEGASIRFGLLIFPWFLIGAALVNFVLFSAPALNNGDELSVWNNMTVYHVLFLALAAGFGEELLYRGVLQPWLGRWMPVGAAIAVQAVFFGFAHGGYGTWAHVLSPLLFGVLTGILAHRWGLWSAIVLHVGVDIVAFAAYAAPDAPWFAWLLGVAFLANVAWSLTVGARWAIRRWRQMGTPPASFG